VGFFAGLGRQSEGNWAAVGLAQNHLLLVDGVGGIPEPGNVEASLLLDIFADNLGDDDILDDAVLDGFGGRHFKRNFVRFSDQRYSVGLGLVLLTAVLVLSSAVVISVTRGTAGGNLHGFRFVLISHLKGCVKKWI